MLVLRGDIADAGVEQADGVVLAADAGELCVERAGVGDRQQVRPVALQVAEERLNVRLVGRGAGPAVVLGDRHQRHELAGVDRGHLGAVVRPRDQDRPVLVVVAEREPVGEQPLVLERAGEQQLHLGVGLLAREQVADPVAGDDVDDRVRHPLGAGEVRRVPNPDPVSFPRKSRKRQLRRSWAEPLAQQSDHGA